MRRIWVSLIAAGLLAIAAFAPVSAQDSITLDLEPVEDSGVAGNVRIESQDGEATVTILLTQGLEDESVHPVHIHEGTCDDLGGVAYPLNNIEDGSSETTIDVDLADLRTGAFAINAHESEENIDTFIACADIPAAVGGDVEDEDSDDSDDASEDEDAAEQDGASEDEGAEDEADDGAAEDDEAADESEDDAAEDEEADESDDQAEEDEDAADDGEEVEQEEVAPATGATDGIGPDTIAMSLMLLAGGGLGAGVLLRRRATQIQRS